MTKSDYREYLGSSDWQERRKRFLLTKKSCANCDVPRWLAEIAYDQDLNVHHVSYANLGNENEDDLEALCRRCHEIEKFGRSDLREIKSTHCELCRYKHWNYYSNRCDLCKTLTGKDALRIIHSFDTKVDNLGDFSVVDFLIMVSMIHNEGMEPMIRTMQKLEPLVTKSMTEHQSPEPVDITF